MHHLIVNPVAGRGRGLPLVERAVAALEHAGFAVAVHHTAEPLHATTIVTSLQEGAVPVAFGGDGTVHEVMVGCLRRGFPMGIVPVGSGDDFAFALGFGGLTYDAALRVLVAGRERLVDVGFVGTEPFVNSFGTGFDADVARRIVDAPTYYRGLGKYLFGIVTAMRDFRTPNVVVTLDGRTVYDGPALLVTVQNGPRTGGSFLFAPDARTDDGLFDVVIAGRFGRMGTLAVLPSVMRARHVGHPRITIHRASEVGVRWSSPVAGHTEGEVLAMGSAFDVRMQGRALRVVAPTG
ncbi:MAG: diacylglycerol kinase family lipid kinase [Trueperaceae bacterium]|nr:diacylglycerol kinase family lipid kinase [Trueperaceae bacterium]